MEDTILIEDIMSKNIITIDKKTKIGEIKEILKKHQVHHLPVIEDKKIVGIVTSNDIHIAEILQLKIYGDIKVNEATASEIMQAEVTSISPKANIKDAAKYFINAKTHALPIVSKSDGIVGIITTNDLIKYIAK